MKEGSTMAIAVFCGSSRGIDPVYLEAARTTGRTLARRGIDVVYGGGHVGLMGAVADAALAAGGRVIGVIPRALDEREVAHSTLTELHLVETMHERKAKMSELSDAFLALPGGPGTLEEITEQWTWAQLGIHEKPVGFLDVNGYYAPLKTMVENMKTAGFTHERYTDMLLFSSELDSSILGCLRPQTRPSVLDPSFFDILRDCLGARDYLAWIVEQNLVLRVWHFEPRAVLS